MIAKAFVNCQALLFELARQCKIPADHGSAAESAKAAGFEVGKVDFSSDVESSLETPFGAFKIAFAAVEETRQHVGQSGARLVADCFVDLLCFSMEPSGFVKAISRPREPANS